MKSRTLWVPARRILLARFLKLSLNALLPVLLVIAASATTLVVGNCKPGGGYPTIQQAINAAPVGATVQVCPGVYAEQVTITQAVTLEGIPANDGDQAIIAPPSSLVLSALDLFGDPVVAQVLVTQATGPVNISNLAVGGHNFTVPGFLFAGIYYQNSPGTISSVVVSGQSGNQLGIGIFLEGGASSPSVAVQNSSLSGIDYAAIDFETVGYSNTALSAKITNNFVLLDIVTSNPAGIQFGSGSTGTVTANSVLGSGTATGSGIVIGAGGAGSVSGNSVMSTASGIQTYADGTSITSNKLSSNGSAIDLRTAIATVKSNTIISPSVGIRFNCINNSHVLSNTINYSTWGFTDVPTGLSTSTNKVFNTQIIRSGSCT